MSDDAKQDTHAAFRIAFEHRGEEKETEIIASSKDEAKEVVSRGWRGAAIRIVDRLADDRPPEGV